jgi:hypothetical protein
MAMIKMGRVFSTWGDIRGGTLKEDVSGWLLRGSGDGGLMNVGCSCA